MGLAARLALSYLVVVGVFLATVIIAFPRLGAPRPGNAPHFWAEEVLARLPVAPDAGDEALVAALRSVDLGPGWASAVFFRDGRSIVVQAVPDLALLRPPTWDGPATVIMRDRGFLVYQPVSQDAVLALGRPGPRRDVPSPLVGVAQSVALAALICLGLGLAFSRALTRPVRSLLRAVRAFGPDDLSQRAPQDAPGELGEFARGFNEMADRLQESLAILRREKDRAERAESSRREFLADVSHNLGTPLSAVQGWVNLLVDGIVTDEKERLELLRKIRRELHYVSRTVLQLLDLSRWAGTGPVLRFEEFPLMDPLMEVAESLQEAAGEAGTELQFEGLDPSLRVRGDRSRVRELFQIFLENAVDHAGRGALVVVRLEPREGRLLVRISDNGVGISPERLATMRQRNQPSGGRGSGLGLAIAHKLAEGHGGDLEIRSLEGEGTTVTFTLPLA